MFKCCDAYVSAVCNFNVTCAAVLQSTVNMYMCMYEYTCVYVYIFKIETGQYIHDFASIHFDCPMTHVAVCCSVLQCVAVCCRVLQRVAVCSIYNWDTTTYPRLCIDTFLLPHDSCCSVLQHVAVCCSVYNWDTTIYPRLCVDTFPLPHDSCLPVHMACHNCPKKKSHPTANPKF